MRENRGLGRGALREWLFVSPEVDPRPRVALLDPGIECEDLRDRGIVVDLECP